MDENIITENNIIEQKNIFINNILMSDNNFLEIGSNYLVISPS